MRTIRRTSSHADEISDALRRFMVHRAVELTGLGLLVLAGAMAVALATWSVTDPSMTHATDDPVQNWLGTPGAIASDLVMQMFGLGSAALLIPCALWGVRLMSSRTLPRWLLRMGLWIVGAAAASAVASALPETARWPLPSGLGGVVGDALLFGGRGMLGGDGLGALVVGMLYGVVALLALSAASGYGFSQDSQQVEDFDDDDMMPAETADRDEPGWGIVSLGAVAHGLMTMKSAVSRRLSDRAMQKVMDARAANAAHMRSDGRVMRGQPVQQPVADYSYDTGPYADDFSAVDHDAYSDFQPQDYAAPEAGRRREPGMAQTARGPGMVQTAGGPAMAQTAFADISPEIAAYAPRERPVRVHQPYRPQPAAPEPVPTAAAGFVAAVAAQEPFYEPVSAPADEPSVPLWRRPFRLPPNTRFTRSTDKELAQARRINDPHPLLDEPAFDDFTADQAAFSQHDGLEHEPFLDPAAAQPVVMHDDGLHGSLHDDFQVVDEDDHEDHLQDGHLQNGHLQNGHLRNGHLRNGPLHDEHPYQNDVDAEESLPVFQVRTNASPRLRASNDDDPSSPRQRSSAPAQQPAGREGAGRVVMPPRRAAVAPAPAAPVPPSPPAPARVAASYGNTAVAAAPTVRRMAAAMPEGEYELPPLDILARPVAPADVISEDALEQNAALLESTLEDFGVRGDIIHVRPGPVVTLYELEPAPGTKSSRVISLADDIARSMSAISARVAVVPGRNAIGIELPNTRRETVFLRELLSTDDFQKTKLKLALCLGKTIGGEPVIAELARMPHLLVAGTTGSGKSVAINTMILSLLYRMKPEECRLIMVDPKMLELSIYDGIPHLLTPVVTDPKKAVVALKWAVREMEERYKKMSKLSVRNIDGFNTRVRDAKAKGEVITRTVQTGFDKATGEAIYEDEVMDLDPLPYIVIVVDEMADLMMVAGKEIEGTIQRLAQMARAAGIHVILATQRPSVDVITGTIKANFPTRISFQVTSKIDSRTILGEQGAEQLLGQGDMLYMAGGGRVMRVHGPFVSDDEVEKIVAHLKTQGRPQYLEAVTAEEETPEDGGSVFDNTAQGASGNNDLYDQAIAIVLRDKKASTSYIQRRLQIGYNRAASIMERMELEGIVGAANHAGKREILLDTGDRANEA